MALLVGCSAYEEVRLSTYDIAMSMVDEDREVDPPAYRASSPPQDLPRFVPYARLSGSFPFGSSEWQMAKLARESRMRGLRADLLLFRESGSVQTGSFSTYLGLGMAMQEAAYRHLSVAWCCRLSPVETGITIDRSGLVLAVDARVHESSGLQEGDTLLNADGHPVVPVDDVAGFSAFDAALLQMRPGREVQLVWTRPGRGRMDGTTVLMPPRAMPSTP